MAAISPTSQSQHEYPSRIKSFCRQNQNSPRRRLFIPLLYIFFGICYIYCLLCSNASSKIYANRNGSISDTPTDIELEPQSLSYVAITNAEALWKKRVQREEFLRKRTKMKEERELHKKSLAELQKKRSNNTSLSDGGFWTVDNENNTNKLLRNATDVTKSLFTSGVSTRNGSTLKRRIKPKDSPTNTNQDAFLPFLLIFTFCTLFRLCFTVAIRRFGDIEDDDDDQTGSSNGVFWTRRQLRRRARAQLRQRQFQNFVDQLNAQRVENGERPIGADSLRLVVSDRDFNGNDYDRLWQFHEENGPAIGSLLSAIGATEAEIGRCPSRVLREGDDLVRREGTATSQDGVDSHSCSVCLEAYRVGDEVRTIPCFHTFHVGCIDPWLSERAECPICKHSAIG